MQPFLMISPKRCRVLVVSQGFVWLAKVLVPAAVVVFGATTSCARLRLAPRAAEDSNRYGHKGQLVTNL